MPTVYVSADSLLPSNHSIETAYFYGSDLPFGPPVQFDPAGNGSLEPLLSSSNTRTTFVYGGNIYRLLNRNTVAASVLCKSTDAGVTWSVLDSANTPLFKTLSGFFDETTSTVICAYNNINDADGHIRLITFDLVAETWGLPNPTIGPVVTASGSIAIWKRSDETLLVIYQSRNTFAPALATGLGAVVYDTIGGAWGTPFDAGANIKALTGWDSFQSIVLNGDNRAVLDPATGILHCVFQTTSTQTVPVVWNHRVFYQQILLNNTLGIFYDFPGQVEPYPPFPYGFQQLSVFSGTPMGVPVIVGDNIVLPVSMRNDSLLDRFPIQLPNVYIGTPVSNPVWSLDSASTIDPGMIQDDFIYAQESPSITFDGTTMFAVYSCQDEDGQNFARLRMAQSTDLVNPAAGWTAQTIFDLQIDAPPGFNFSTQFVSGAGAFSPQSSPPVVQIQLYLNAQALSVVILPDPSKVC